MDFNTETKWCANCKTYVRYMMSVNASYCAACGGPVRLFNTEDLARFNTDLEKKRWKAS